MKQQLTNEQCRDEALKQAKLGNHYMALRWYNTARARTIGHNKSADYERLAREQAKLAGINYASASTTYAEDWEA